VCRLLALASLKPNEGLIKEIVGAFVESSRRDPYLERISGGKLSAHDDGWGSAALGLFRGKPTLAFHRSIEPIFYENSKSAIDLLVKKASKYDSLYLLLHSRKGSPGEPYGLDYTHPFMRISERCVGWFAHNGGANKEELAKKLGVNPWIRVDSELLGYYLLDNVFTCVESGGNVDECVKRAYEDAVHYVVEGSALSTVLLLLVDSQIHLYATHYTRNVESNERKQYFATIAYEGEGFSLAGSITIKEYLTPRGKIRYLEPGVYRVEPSGVIKISSL
jgi:glutamine amidotransferase